MIVAVDGPAGSGKGTVTKKIEEELGFLNLDLIDVLHYKP